MVKVKRVICRHKLSLGTADKHLPGRNWAPQLPLTAASASGTENANSNSGNIDSNDALNFQRAVVPYVKLLPEIGRESVDAPSPEGIAAQKILNQQTGIIARSIAGNVKDANGQDVPEASVTSLMTAFNNCVIEYTAAQQILGAADDHAAVDAAAANTIAALGAIGQNKAKLKNTFTTHKNAVLESSLLILRRTITLLRIRNS